MKSCILYFVHLFLIFLPETRCYAFKRILLRIAGAKIGKMSILAASSTAKGVYPDNSLLKGCIAKFSHTLKN